MIGGRDKLRQLALVVLVVFSVGALLLAVQTRERDDEALDEEAGRIETVGDLAPPEQSQSSDDDLNDGADTSDSPSTDSNTAVLGASSGPSRPSLDNSATLSSVSTTATSRTTSTKQATTRPPTTDPATTEASTTVTAAPTTEAPATTPTTVPTATTPPTTERPTTTTRPTTAPPTTPAPTAPPTTRPTTTTTIAPIVLRNGGFESASLAAGAYRVVASAEVPGWQSSSGLIELWHGDKQDAGAVDGSYLVELNVRGPTTIHQDFATTPMTTIRWTFSHRGRDDRDTVEVLIGPSNGNLSSVMTASTGLGWKRYTGTTVIPAGQRSTRIAFRAVDSGGSGNLLDAVSVSVVTR